MGTVQGVAESQTGLSESHFHFQSLFAYHLHSFYNSLHSIYIGLGIISNLEMI